MNETRHTDERPEPPVETGLDGVAAQPRRIDARWSDLAIALTAIALSGTSLIMGVRQSQTQERLQAASTWPFMSYGTSNAEVDGERRIVMAVENVGVGPALLRHVRMTYDGRPVRSSLELMQACCGFAPGLSVTDLRGLTFLEIKARVGLAELSKLEGLTTATLPDVYAANDRREQVGDLAGPRPGPAPDAGAMGLPPDPHLVLEPDLDRRAGGQAATDARQRCCRPSRSRRWPSWWTAAPKRRGWTGSVGTLGVEAVDPAALSLPLSRLKRRP